MRIEGALGWWATVHKYAEESVSPPLFRALAERLVRIIKRATLESTKYANFTIEVTLFISDSPSPRERHVSVKQRLSIREFHVAHVRCLVLDSPYFSGKQTACTIAPGYYFEHFIICLEIFRVLLA